MSRSVEVHRIRGPLIFLDKAGCVPNLHSHTNRSRIIVASSVRREWWPQPRSARSAIKEERHGSFVGFFPRLLGLRNLPVAVLSYRRRARVRRVHAGSSRKNRHRPQPSRSRGGLSDGLGRLLGGRAMDSGAGLGIQADRRDRCPLFARGKEGRNRSDDRKDEPARPSTAVTGPETQQGESAP